MPPCDSEIAGLDNRAIQRLQEAAKLWVSGALEELQMQASVPYTHQLVNSKL